MNKLNFLKPDKKNMTTYLYSGLFLFNKSKFFIPENSILIRCKPIIPKAKGSKKLIKFGKNDVIFILKKELKNTSNNEIKNKNEPLYKYVVIFFISGFKTFNLFIIFL